MKGIWEEILGQEAQAKGKPNTSESEIGIDQILGMRLSDFTQRNYGVRIYSEVLGCEIWLCGTEKMADQIRQDDPGVSVYTADELRKLLTLTPDPQSLRSIHDTKTVFPTSKVIEGMEKVREEYRNDKASI